MSTTTIRRASGASGRPIVDVLVERVALALLAWSLRRSERTPTPRQRAQWAARERMRRTRDEQIIRMWACSLHRH